MSKEECYNCGDPATHGIDSKSVCCNCWGIADMTSAYVPYNGTAGWSGTDTSEQRALDNIHSGRELTNQVRALHLLKKQVLQG